MHVRKIAWSSHLCRPLDWPKSSHIFLLPWCTAIAGYHTSRKTSYNHWVATDKQEICYRVQVSQGERKPPQTEDTHDNSRMLTLYLCSMHEQWLNLCLYHWCIYDKRIVTSCTMWHLPQKIRVFWLLCNILSTDYFVTIYATDNL